MRNEHKLQFSCFLESEFKFLLFSGNLYNLDLDLNRVLLTVAFVLIIYGVFSILLLVGIYRVRDKIFSLKKIQFNATEY